MVVMMLIWLVNIGIFGNGFVVKNLISKQFKCRRIQNKMVEVKDGFVVKDGNTETNGIAIQTNGMQRAMDCGDTKKQFGAANSLGILLKIQGATHDWKYMEQFGKTNVPERMHGACDSAAGDNVLCATVTRTAR